MFRALRMLAVAGSLVVVSSAVQALIVQPPPSTTGGGSNPDCSGAAASLGVIWPPNDAMVAVNVVGVVDPNGLPITIMVTGIQQDEAVNALGSGNTAPDAGGVGTPTALVRAERAGPGTGRLYFIDYTATNTQGGQCTGTVMPYVPHDQGQGFTPVDTGLRFDSTVVPN